MPTNTYVALAKTTITVANTDTVLFESIPSTYTDLRLVVSGNVESGTNNAFIAFNNDFNVNTASGTTIIGNGTTATSSRRTNDSVIYMTIPLVTSSTTKSIWVVDIMNYASTNMFKTVLWRYSDAGNRTQAGVGLKQLTSSITSLNFSTGAGVSKGNWAVGSTFSLYGIKAQVTPGTAKATGGTITYDNFGNVYHTFTSTGTFEPLQNLVCDYAVVAGGGGGGTRWAGGGGAGGLRSTFDATGGGGSLETPISLSPNNYTITVGGPGAGATGTYVAGSQGNNSTFSTITSIGGGGGGTSSAYATTGGSGGGGGMRLSGLAGLGAAGTAGQGYAGGNAASSGGYAGGGGGGAGAVGQTADNSNFSNAGNGGNGVTIYVGGSALSLAGGGGGGSEGGGTFYGDGGLGGGGNGNSSAGQGSNGTINTGGGGGGGGNDSGTGGSGGSGRVIIRYQG